MDLENPKNFKTYNREYIRKYTRSQDKVGVLGGGLGATPYEALKITDDVTAYEPDKRREEELNKIDDLDVKHAFVGAPVDVKGTVVGATPIYPEDLPDYDLLEIDIEGAEVEVLKNLTIKPRVIIVETHPKNGSTEDKLTEILADDYKLIEAKEDPTVGQVLVFKRN